MEEKEIKSGWSKSPAVLWFYIISTFIHTDYWVTDFLFGFFGSYCNTADIVGTNIILGSWWLP